MADPVARLPSTRDGFTLIEMIAVVLIIGLATSLVVPNLSATRAGRLKEQARQVAHRLEVARQRAITSGVPHRLYMDLEEGFMRIDWWVDEATAYPVDDAYEPSRDMAAEEEANLDGPIAMSPPRGEAPDFHPIAGAFGRAAQLDDDYYFVGVDSESGWFESGAVEVVFGSDGVAEFSIIRMADAWDNQIRIEVAPLLELVHIREGADG